LERITLEAHLVNVTHDNLLHTSVFENLPCSGPLATSHNEHILWAVNTTTYHKIINDNIKIEVLMHLESVYNVDFVNPNSIPVLVCGLKLDICHNICLCECRQFNEIDDICTLRLPHLKDSLARSYQK